VLNSPGAGAKSCSGTVEAGVVGESGDVESMMIALRVLRMGCGRKALNLGPQPTLVKLTGSWRLGGVRVLSRPTGGVSGSRIVNLEVVNGDDGKKKKKG
jgi:hypothetical protein